jgi:hypothetical protein
MVSAFVWGKFDLRSTSGVVREMTWRFLDQGAAISNCRLKQERFLIAQDKNKVSQAT